MYSINYVRIKPGNNDVIKINNSISDTMNCDFDGDEINVLITVN